MLRPASPDRLRGFRLTCGALAALSVLPAGCSFGRPAATESVTPSVEVTRQAPPAERVMRVTMLPKVREVQTLRGVTHDAQGGLTLRQGTPATLHVSATGSANGHVEAWLEGQPGVVGRTALSYEAASDRYVGVINLEAGQVAAGEYDVKAVLEVDGKEATEVVTAVDPVRLSLEGLPDALKAEVEAWSAHFDTDSSVLTAEDQGVAGGLVAKLEPFAQYVRSIRVVGHCDLRGSEQHNTALGGNRAASLAKMLSGRLPGVTVGIESAGSADPNPPGDDQGALAQNRWARLVLETK